MHENNRFEKLIPLELFCGFISRKKCRLNMVSLTGEKKPQRRNYVKKKFFFK